MSESKALVADAYLQPERWTQMEKLAQSLVMSKALPRDVQNAAQALVKMQYGLEIGLKPMQSLSGTMIINGAVNPWGKTVTLLLRNAGWKIEYKDEPNKCTATVTKDDESYTETLTFEEAVKSKWVYQYRKDSNGNKVVKDGKYVQDLKVGWYEGANRKLKLRYGALSMILKSYIPEVLGGAQDIAEVAEDFEIIEQVAEPTDKKHEEVITTTPDERKQGLAEFLEKNKNNPNKQPKPSKSDEKTQKTVGSEQKSEKTTSNSAKHVQILDQNAEMQDAIEGEIVTNESKE